MTIPTLMANYQKTQYVSQLKKAYTSLNQALLLYKVNDGEDFPSLGEENPWDFFEARNDKLVKYFQISKNCGYNYEGCWADTISTVYNNDDASADFSSTPCLYAFVLADGITFLNADNVFYVDVNGANKKPNRLGRDIFELVYFSSLAKLCAFGSVGCFPYVHQAWKDDSGNIQHCSPSEPTGSYCSGRIMDESWQMNY